MHDVERSRYDVVIEGGQDASQRAGRRPIFPRRSRQPAPAREPQTRSGKRRQSPGFVIFRVVKRLWIVLVILAVIGGGGLTVRRLHGMFGSENRLSYAGTRTDDTKPANPQHMRYEVFGPPGTLAGISYFDANGDLQIIKDTPLPWSLEFTVTPATAGGNIVAQGDSDSIGCRIVVDGVVKEEKITHAVSAFTFCRQKSDE